MRTTRSTDVRSTDPRSTRPKGPRLRVAGVAVALVAGSSVAAGVVRALPPSAAGSHHPVCGAAGTDARNMGPDACDDLHATYHLPHAWPQKRAAATAAPGKVLQPSASPDQATTWTAIALAESGGA